MKASLHLKDGRGNHRILSGQYENLSNMLKPDFSRAGTALEAQETAHYQVRVGTGIVPASPILICIDCGEKK